MLHPSSPFFSSSNPIRFELPWPLHSRSLLTVIVLVIILVTNPAHVGWPLIDSCWFTFESVRLPWNAARQCRRGCPTWQTAAGTGRLCYFAKHLTGFRQHTIVIWCVPKNSSRGSLWDDCQDHISRVATAGDLEASVSMFRSFALPLVAPLSVMLA